MIDDELAKAERAVAEAPGDEQAQAKLQRIRRRVFPGMRVRMRVVPCSWIDWLSERAFSVLGAELPPIASDEVYEIVTTVAHADNGYTRYLTTSAGQSFSCCGDDFERLPVWTFNLGEVEVETTGQVERRHEESGRAWIEERTPP